jgi:hypothetical protein
VRMLKTAGPTKADLYVVDVGEGPLVVKDFGRKAWWVRLIGRLQISRECRAYDWLGPMPGVARLVGRVDAHALALEWIDGEQLSQAAGRLDRGEALYERLREIVGKMHRKGLMHLDLRGRENVMLGNDDRIHVLDLASAIWFRPDGWPRRLFARWFELTDTAALLKWKRLLKAGAYTDDEESFLRRYRFWRALWVFNRKRPGKRTGGHG